MNLKKMTRLIAAPLLFAAFSFSASATVLDFEDIGGSNNVVPFPGNYHGFNFAVSAPYNLDVVDVTNPSSPWGVHGPAHSGQNIALNDNGLDGIIDSLIGPVTYDGAWFKAWAGAGTTLSVQGYLNGNLVGSTSFILSNSWQFVSGFSSLVDEIRVLDNNTIFMMDDFTFNSAPVPEPASLALLGLGLAGLGFARRRKQDQATA